jgi:hypothetical protein
MVCVNSKWVTQTSERKNVRKGKRREIVEEHAEKEKGKKGKSKREKESKLGGEREGD